MQSTSWKGWAVGSLAALTMMAGGLWAVDGVSAAEPEPTAAVDATVAPALQMVQFGRGGPENRFGQSGETADEAQSRLAEALGIRLEQLEAAQDAARTKARDEALAQAVADGDLTQAQADAIKELEGLWGDRGIGLGYAGGPKGFGAGYSVAVDEYDAYLAEALGISVEELQTAKDAAMQAGIAQAVADGEITQEQADQMTAHLALRDYLADELDGVLAAAIENAIADGVITQEQASQVQEEWSGFGNRGMRDGYPGMRDGYPGGMHGGFLGGPGGDFDGGRGLRGGFPGGMRGNFGAPYTQGNTGMNIVPGSTL